MKTLITIILSVLLICGTAMAQEIRRAIPVKPSVTSPTESGRQWMKRTFKDGEYMPYAFEVDYDSPLATDKPYELPRRGNPFFNEHLEQMVGGHDNYNTVRVFKCGVFIGYAMLQFAFSTDTPGVVVDPIQHQAEAGGEKL
jgi:hypothetical protein